MRILGIDPGIATTGFAVIEKEKNTIKVLEMGVFSTPAGLDTPDRLVMIRSDILSIIKAYGPKVAAVEQLFFATNTKTALTVAHARGVLVEAIVSSGVKFYEFTPLQVKQAVTGYGKADKKQMQLMLQMILGSATPPKQDDAADALGIAICLSQSLPFLDKL